MAVNSSEVLGNDRRVNMPAPDHVKDLDRQTDRTFETGAPSTDGRLSSEQAASSCEARTRKLDNGLKIVGEWQKVKVADGNRRVNGLKKRRIASSNGSEPPRSGGERSEMTERPISITMPDDGRTLRGLVLDGAGPAVVWLGGFRSDMTGTKAEAVVAWGRQRARKVVRFDYSGHGGSDGDFEDGRIGRWFEEAKAVIAAEAGPEFVVAGSSMGGWMALLLANERPQGLKGVVLVAPAPDFTEKLFYPALPPEARARVDAGETIEVPGEYGSQAYRLAADFFRDGARHNLLDAPFRLGIPVIIIQGMADTSVPYLHAQRIVDRLVDDDVVLTLVKDGDHRLSRPSDIDLILDAIGRVTEE